MSKPCTSPGELLFSKWGTRTPGLVLRDFINEVPITTSKAASAALLLQQFIDDYEAAGEARLKEQMELTNWEGFR